MSSLSTGTTVGTALVHTADTSGDFLIKTGSSATTAMTISGSTQAVTLAGSLVMGSSTLAAPTGSAPAFMARAWVNFNGTGTPAIRASGNVSSITDNGTGDYTINFTTAMPDANYAASCICTDDSAANRGINLQGTSANVTASSFRINIFANADPSVVCAIAIH